MAAPRKKPTMVYELVRTFIQKVLQDKILLGLVIVGFLGIFVGGMAMHDEKPAVEVKQPPNQAAPQGAAVASDALTPALARDFVTWWIGEGGAFDYGVQSAAASHNNALVWMTPDAQQQFIANFWTPAMAEQVRAGAMVGAFHPTLVHPEAVNPDGSVVVGVDGTLVLQQSTGQPLVHQFRADFLVQRTIDGLRVAGLNNRTLVVVGSSSTY